MSFSPSVPLPHPVHLCCDRRCLSRGENYKRASNLPDSINTKSVHRSNQVRLLTGPVICGDFYLLEPQSLYLEDYQVLCAVVYFRRKCTGHGTSSQGHTLLVPLTSVVTVACGILKQERDAENDGPASMKIPLKGGH